MSRRQLPSVDRVLRDPGTAPTVQRWGLRTVTMAVRALQADARDAAATPDWATRADGYGTAVDAWLERRVGHGYVTAFNLTGILVHTNLGRSPLAEDAVRSALAAATRPLTLEYDPDTGRRGDREGIVSHRLRLLTGAEAATVVNNNAAAVLLVLNTLARDRNVPVSRGELIEIGGSFRLPEVMESAGCRLREVGTTNRTHADDYERAIDAHTGALLKVHPSNFRVTGFTREVTVREVADIAHRHDLPAIVDAGSGALLDLTRFGLPKEPTPDDLFGAGADLVTFSGDKLLGGVQAGIVVGKRELVDKVNANPMKRALRLDKIALVLLDATLKAYEDEPTATTEIPLLRTIASSTAELDDRAASVAAALARLPDATVAVEPSRCQVGSGALPGEVLHSRAVTVAFRRGRQLGAFAARLRRLRPAVIGRVHEGRLWLDMRGAEPLDELVALLSGLQS